MKIPTYCLICPILRVSAVSSSAFRFNSSKLLYCIVFIIGGRLRAKVYATDSIDNSAKCFLNFEQTKIVKCYCETAKAIDALKFSHRKVFTH